MLLGSQSVVASTDDISQVPQERGFARTPWSEQGCMLAWPIGPQPEELIDLAGASEKLQRVQDRRAREEVSQLLHRC
jgi:hypothetical protein